MKNENLKPLKVEELTKSEMGHLTGGFLVVSGFTDETADINVLQCNSGCTVNNVKRCGDSSMV